jgi:hypothetical protein
LYLSQDSILRQTGWLNSKKQGLPVDRNGDPVPWYTYAMIDFLRRRVSDEHRVFEYGGGYSTLWYAKRVESVVAVEDSEIWAENIRPNLPENGDIIYQSKKKSISLNLQSTARSI